MYKLFTLAALASVVAASLHGSPHGSPVAECNTGPVQCCNIVDNFENEDVANALGLVGVVVQDLNIPIGVNCVPISAVIGIGGNSCSQQPVCCEENNFNGLVALGCTPINANL
ncbi:hydrophobin [Moniliophthora roreri MCA 2997]|uniref:Hydrophobin n=2 Tax=Moniliophthora roreri TaxID=221103 RepID=V2YA81_MONRO|nr:hydrophobin [Moniliophthora roreri MCA 2997]KAI3621405.1 hydrophobin [Moniliophthora roreri]